MILGSSRWIDAVAMATNWKGSRDSSLILRHFMALPCGSASTTSTLYPAWARPPARFMQAVVLPQPPFWFATAIVMAICTYHTAAWPSVQVSVRTVCTVIRTEINTVAPASQSDVVPVRPHNEILVTAPTQSPVACSTHQTAIHRQEFVLDSPHIGLYIPPMGCTI